MANIDQFVKVGFTISKATSLAIFFSNIGYLCTATQGDFVDGYTIPTNKIIAIATIETLKDTFKSDTQYYKDIETLLTQRNNLRPNKSGVNEVIVYVGTLSSGETYGNLVDEFISVNANFARMTIDSRNVTDILEAAKKAQVNDVRFIAQTSSSTISGATSGNILAVMNGLSLDLIDVDYHTDDTEALACADGAVATQEIMGSVGDLYSQFTNVSPKEYNDTIETNLKHLYASFYTTVAFKEGGSLDNYAQKLLLGGYTVTGEDRKRRDIRYYIDKIFKARALDFLAKKLPYENSSANILNEMFTKILLEGQINNIIVEDEYDEETQQTIKGFQIRPIYPTQLKRTNPTAYNAKRYQFVGYYIDALTGREVAIDLYVDPEDYEKAQIGF
jgi:hypothetical protein